ncbi:hypothetical protein LTR56_000005 [Elasticomyces elasticus]|nr:hypothetical protein LTR22_016356 [Elasticomyces elasticus]KAK3661519.1 hypothetical protein LTR56_000005 [Elasticomyces elasticus]KAK4932770.1 hypothetical protein LTR49_000724 [Elasticomyces elasticus]KAK5758215.1 hypothetical protein LTS12_011685 [Elasticomyces elasticus]
MDPDPWNWQPADVQQWFRHSAVDHISDRPTAQLPVLEPFLQKLAENDVDGASLLDSTVDTESLRDDFGIKSMRVRGTILHCVNKLKLRSAAHRAQVGLSRPETPVSLSYIPHLASSALDTPTPVNAIPSTEIETGEHVRSGEYEVQDKQGRKRRKLDLTNGQTAVQVASPNATTNGSPKADGSSYTPDAALTVDEVFYGPIGLGNEVGDLMPSGNMLVEGPDTETADDNFQFTSNSKNPAEAEFVYARMRHFFTNPDLVHLRRRGRVATGILPYPEHLSNVRSALVVQVGKDDEEYVATREKALLLEGGYEHTELQQGSTSEWDFMLQKHKQGSQDVELPVYGESEGSDTVSQSATVQDDSQMASEDNEEVIKDVEAIVDEYISMRVAEWRETKMPKLEIKEAWSVWKKTKGSNTARDDLIGGAQARVRYLSDRLAKIRDWMGVDYDNNEAIFNACGGMDITIDDREVQKWRISVWQRRKEPDHVVKQNKSTTRTAHTPAVSGPSAPSFMVHPDDRLSVSPTPATRYAALGVDTEDDAEGDGEVFHTPVGSPGADADGFDAEDEMSVDHDQSEGDNDDEEQPDAEMADFLAAEDADDDKTEEEMQEPIVIASSPPRLPSAPASAKKILADASMPPPGAVHGTSDSEELPPISTFIKKIKHVARPETPAQRSQVIDLTAVSSDSAAPSPAKSKQPMKLSASAKKALLYNFSDQPNEAAAAQVEGWDWAELATRQDRHRMLIKMLREAGPEKRAALQALSSKSRKKFTELLQSEVDHRREGTFDDEAPAVMETCASMLMAYYEADPSFWTEARVDGPWSRLKHFENQIVIFVNLLSSILQRRNTKLFAEAKTKGNAKAATRADPSSATMISSSDAEPVSRTPHKKRKKEVAASQAAITARRTALQRQEQYREALESQAADTSQIAALDGAHASKSEIVINPARNVEEEDAIFIHPLIARRMKAHQIDGVRFMWREVTAVDDEDGAQGCLLAHTMGLGKTMQAIALLVAVTETSVSPIHSVHQQLPEHLRPEDIRGERQLRILILCPSGLVQNWQRELKEWAPKALRVFIVEASNKAKQPRAMEAWYEKGGVLLIGYPLFRSFIERNTVLQQKQDGERLDELLLEGPEMVVADEAHSLKNPKSAISKAAAKIHTHTRIALTGTPMSNDVDEIYALVSWVAPDYLGDPSWFRANFAEPIKEGTYAESTPWEKRKSLMKLKVLHNDIMPKVDRADITALRGSLKSKTEFVITVPLTKTQTTLYKRCIDALIGGGKNQKASQTRIFSWLGVLMLLTAHPVAFRRKLLTPVPPKKPKKGTTSRGDTPAESDDGSAAASAAASAAVTDVTEVINDDGQLITKDPEDEDLFALGFDQAGVDAIIDSFEDDIDPALSAKMPLFLSILNLSLGCRDKVLVFSGSIPTLDYVSDLLKDQTIDFKRIDGNTPVPKRMDIIENFHNDDFDVLLVSTRAGGVGLNIQGANRVIILDFSFNPTWEEQAIGRAYRLGQQKPVFVYRFVAGGTFETNIYNKQLFKMSLTQRVVDKKNPKRNAQRNTRDYLYEPKEVRQEDIQKWVGKDPKVMDVLLQQHEDGEHLMRSIQTTETLEEDAQDAPLDEEEQKMVDEEIQLGRTKQRGKLAAAAVPVLDPATYAQAMANAMGGLPNGRTMAPPATTQVMRRASGLSASAQAGPSATRPPAASAPVRRQSSTPAGLPAFQPLMPEP